MDKLDLLFERIRKLPLERQEAVAVYLDVLICDEETGRSLLTDEQWAEVEASLADEGEEEIPHAEIVAEFRTKFPS